MREALEVFDIAGMNAQERGPLLTFAILLVLLAIAGLMAWRSERHHRAKMAAQQDADRDHAKSETARLAKLATPPGANDAQEEGR